MQISRTSLLVALFGATVALAAPVAEPETVGALYFIDNDASGNSVVASDIRNDGTIKLVGKTSAGGNGMSGVSGNNTNGPDALFSQGAVATTGGKNLFAVNAGSNTVAMFSVDPKTLTSLKMVGSPAESGGEFPVSVAFNAKREMACVLNGGAKNGVRCFKADGEKGLQVMTENDRDFGLNQTTPPNGPANTVSHLIFDEAGENLLVSVKGTPPAAQGFLASFAIDADGKLAAEPVKTAPEGGLLPFGMAIVPGQSSVLVTDPGVGVVVFDYKNAKDGKATTKATKVDGQMATCWAAHSPKTDSFFVTDIAAGTLVEATVDKNNIASIVSTTSFPATVGPIDLAMASSEKLDLPDFIYINGAKSQTIQMLSTAGTGKVSKVSDFDLKPAAAGLGIKLSTAMQGMAVNML